MSYIKLSLEGVAPLLMHNPRLASPTDAFSRQIAALTALGANITEEQNKTLHRLKFEGAIYFKDDIGPYIPGSMIDGNLVKGGAKEKLGPQIKAGVMCYEDYLPLIYKGPRTVEDLWQQGFYDQRFVKIGRARVLQTRPRFLEGWRIEPTVFYDPELIDYDQVMRSITRGGYEKAIGDYRPRFGKFKVTVLHHEEENVDDVGRAA